MMPAPAGFPGSKELAGLWRELRVDPSQAFWIGHLLLHRIEAPVELAGPAKLAPLLYQALGAFGLGDPVTLATLDQRLPLGTGLLLDLVRQLAAMGLVEPAELSGWKLSATGQESLARPSGPVRLVERRTFHFLELGGAEAPVFVPLAPGWAVTLSEPGDWQFSLNVLTDCLGRDQDWKLVQGFPLDVAGLYHPLSNAAFVRDPAASPGPPIDQAEMLTVALVGHSTYSWHPIDPRTWRPLTGGALARLGPEHLATKALGRFMSAPPAAAVQRAWAEWAQRRGLPEKDARTCQVLLEGGVLHVSPPAELTPRLRRLPLEEEGYLLIGEGPLRRAVRIDVATGTPRQGRR